MQIKRLVLSSQVLITHIIVSRNLCVESIQRVDVEEILPF